MLEANELVESNSELRAGRKSWVPTLQLAMQEVFELMLACPLKVSGGPGGRGTRYHLDGRVSGTVVRDHVGAVQHRSPQARMASRMLGIDVEKAGPELWDAVGEICNMVAGNFKNKITGLGDGCMLSVPTVITGTEYNLHSMVNDEMHTDSAV